MSKLIEGQTRNVIAPGYMLVDTKQGRIKTTKSGDRPEPYIAHENVPRNSPCKCGSGKKFKNCCGGNK